MFVKYFLIAFNVFFWSEVLAQNKDSVSFYLVKQRWHTGIVINTSELSASNFPLHKLVQNYKYCDIGWGDEEFYRHPDFDLELAIKALFYPTKATLRVEGFNFDINKYLSLNDKAYEIKIDRSSFDSLCSFISSTFIKDSSGNAIVVEQRYGGNISFFEAGGKYSFLNTCNTWVAAGLNKAGMDVSTKIILVEQLFNEIKDLDPVTELK